MQGLHDHPVQLVDLHLAPDPGAGDRADQATPEPCALLQAVRVADHLEGDRPADGLPVDDQPGRVDADVLLDAVEEMRDAGAEVIEVNDSIRVVASTWFGADASGLVIDGQPVSRPITFDVIGDPHSLEEAARFRGGIVSAITGPGIGGQVQIDQQDRVVVESLHASRENQYAQPASPPPTPR